MTNSSVTDSSVTDLDQSLSFFAGRLRMGEGQLSTTRKIPGVKYLVEKPDVEVFCHGDSPQLQYHRADDRLICMLGYSHDASCSTALQIASRDPSDIDGNFAILDLQLRTDAKPKVRLTSDKFGHRTLFYTECNNELWFASHFQILASLGKNEPLQLDADAVLHHYHFNSLPRDRTFFAGFKKLEPGVELTAAHNLELHRYFELLQLYQPHAFEMETEANLVSTIRDQMRRAVQMRAENCRSIALGLSGGVDSGFIANLLLESEISFKAINVSYGRRYSELDRIEQFEAATGKRVRRIEMDGNDVIRTFENSNKVASEPVSIASTVVFALSEHARSLGCDSLWDGDGADRMFCGMNSHMRQLKSWRLFWRLKRFGLAPLAIGALARSGRFQKVSIAWQNLLDGRHPLFERTYARTSRFDRSVEQRLYQLSSRRLAEAFDQPLAPNFDLLAYLTFVGLTWSPELFFRSSTEQLMCRGLKQISPFWSTDLIRLAMSLPSELKLKNGQTKYILREAASTDGGNAYWNLPKIGLPGPAALVNDLPEGRQWMDHLRRQAIESEAYRIVSETTESPDPSVLVPLVYWMNEFESRQPASAIEQAIH